MRQTTGGVHGVGAVITGSVDLKVIITRPSSPLFGRGEAAGQQD